jgi:hypothetical protein
LEIEMNDGRLLRRDGARFAHDAPPTALIFPSWPAGSGRPRRLAASGLAVAALTAAALLLPPPADANHDRLATTAEARGP